MRVTDQPLEPFGETMLELSLPSALSLKTALVLRMVRLLVERGCLPSGPNPWAELVLDEALANAIVHGNRRDPRKMVHVRLFADDSRWGAIFEDQGVGFDPRKLGPRDAIANVLEESGRGIMLMEGYVDELVYTAAGNAVMLARRRQGAPAPEGLALESADEGLPMAVPAQAARSGDVGLVRVAVERASQENIGEITEVVESLLPSVRALVLDISRVGFITSIFLRLLVTSHRNLKGRNGWFILGGPQPAVREVLQAVALDKVIEVVDDPREALRLAKQRCRAGGQAGQP